MNPEWGKYLMGAGIILLLLGAVVYFLHNYLHWIGRLPGDIRIEREHFRFYFPLSTLIVFSLLFSLLLWLIRKFL